MEKYTKWISSSKASLWRTLGLFFILMGPGIITSNVDNDAGGITTYSLAGAEYGLKLVWWLIPIMIALIVIQEMGARMGVVTGKGLSDLIREKFGAKITFYLMIGMFLTNMGNVISEFAGIAADSVVAPAMGGVIIGHELARALGLASMFVERPAGRFELRRGFALAPGERVLLCEDVVTTGLSSREAIAAVEAAGGRVVAAACLVDRSDGTADVGVPLVPLVRLAVPSYAPDSLPPELAAIPPVKPGSRAAAPVGAGGTMAP